MENQNLWGLTKLADLNLKAELMPPFYFLPLAHKTLFSNMSASFGGQWSEIESGTTSGEIWTLVSPPFQAGAPLCGRAPLRAGGS